MKIQILGMGCPKCKKLYKNAEEAISELDLEDAELEKVQDLSQIAAMGGMMTPALAVDGEIKAAGRIASVEEITGFITGTLNSTES
ncbi:MAG: thioredoxin family protein [Candidatus Aegiribacteria sp.]|nr:thioredoxin family protein [Candidatus Aegiribacteria sp.]MBD3294340.1 thioredoxin family protein [Candidatus Fermentibacteria bacterium]